MAARGNLSVDFSHSGRFCNVGLIIAPEEIPVFLCLDVLFLLRRYGTADLERFCDRDAARDARGLQRSGD